MYKAAVIGLGKIGLLFDLHSKQDKPLSHTVAYRLDPDIELVAAVGTRTEQRDNLHKLAPEVPFYTDAAEMLRNHRPDVVSICTPPTVRYDLIRMVLELAQPRVVFCEKPVAPNIAEAERIAALMAGSGAQLVPNLSRRWNDGLARVRAAVKDGRYGALRKMQLRYTRGIYNSGSHLFDMVRYFAGGIDSVQVVAEVPTSLDAAVEPSYSFLFTAGGDGSVAGYAEAFDDRDYNIFEIDLFFERGRIEIVRAGDEVRYYRAGETPLVPQFLNLIQERTETGLMRASSNIQNAVAHIVDMMKNGAEPICTIEDGNYPLYVADALIRSRRSGGTVQYVTAK